jgi:peptidoglycan/LPS O-acetylase OafA/YrhL
LDLRTTFLLRVKNGFYEALYVNRGLRILPALIVEVALSAFVLDAIFTTLPLSEYFTAPASGVI